MRTTIIAIVALVIIAGAVYFLTGFSKPIAPSTAAAPTSFTFYCDSGKTMQATFATSTVALTLSDGRSFSLPEVESGSGIRYEATTTGTDGVTATDVVLEGEGDNAFLTENGQTTYNNCTAAVIAPASTSGFDTYTDPSDTFSFTYPSTFMVAGSAPGYSTSWSALATTSGMTLATVDVPKSYEPNTNFGDAAFTVGVSSDPSALAMCLVNPSPNPEGTTTQVTIDGMPFTKLTYGDVGAGNYYDTTSYRMVMNGLCYAVEYTIHYANFENYPPDTVTEFNEASLESTLDQVAQSFMLVAQPQQ